MHFLLQACYDRKITKSLPYPDTSLCMARLIEITKYFEAEMRLLLYVKCRVCCKTPEKQQALLRTCNMKDISVKDSQGVRDHTITFLAQMIYSSKFS